MERAKLLDQILLAPGTGDGDTGEVLDGALAGVGSFGGTDFKRKMADKGNSLFAGLVSQGEIGVAGSAVVNFHEVGAAFLDFADDAAGVLAL